MLDFSLTEEQRNIRDLAHDFAEQEIRPVAWECDRDATWPQEIIDKAWEVGLMYSQFPERYGETGASSVDGALIGEDSAGVAPRLQPRSGPTSSPPRRCCSAARSRSRPST
jgi:acyl-CoA dehydrogenase